MNPVSRRIEGGIQSEYFDVEYRPSEDNKNSALNGKCTTLLVALAGADITRKDKQIENLMYRFCESLLLCNTKEELHNFNTFMDKVASVGGFAELFNKEVKVMISEDGKTAAEKIIKSLDEKKEKTESSSKLDEFTKTYAKLNNELAKYNKKSMTSDTDTSLLLEMYQRLYSNLQSLKGTIDNEAFAKYNGQIKEIIGYLSSIRSALSELNKPISRY